MTQPHLWLRHEVKPGEGRCPLTPEQASELLALGFSISVERSETRAFSDTRFEQAGCDMVPGGSWVNAPLDAIIFGLKELPEGTFPLVHTHIYFAHCFKEQTGWKDLMRRFAAGDGRVLDLEFLVDDQGKRVAAFGYWAGFAGAAVAADLFFHRATAGDDAPLGGLTPHAGRAQWVASLRAKSEQHSGPALSMMVIGALGRCGQGAIELAEAIGCEVTAWDMAETVDGGPFPQILSHDVFINCVYLGGPTAPFVTRAMLRDPRRLSVISDVSCDPSSPYNPLPIYKSTTTFFDPVIRVDAGGPGPALDIIAIDHLPGLLPREASESYAADLFAHIRTLGAGSVVWDRAHATYERVLGKL